MKRDLADLHNQVYDLIVIGGGIYGSSIAWDATLRGLSVALIEKGDFGHATSANSLKTIHGGLRHLQHFELKRMRVSIRERTNWMRIAAHMVYPLPFLIPAYGHSLKGQEVLGIALLLYDLISFDRNQLRDPHKYLPPGRIISKEECLNLLPDLESRGLTGGAIWYDAQMYNSERLTLSFVLSAVQAGARAANYLEAIGLLREKGRVTGVIAQDRLTGDSFDLRARTVVLAAGPWTDQILRSEFGQGAAFNVRLAKAVNVGVRQLFEEYAVGFSNSTGDRPRNGNHKKGGEFLFISPWRNRSIVGTTYQPYHDGADQIEIHERDILDLLDEVNRFYPPARLGLEDVSFVHRGLVPISEVEGETAKVKRVKRQLVQDHSGEGLPGLVSVIGTKYTTARDVAEKVVDLVYRSWGKEPPRSKSAFTSLHGGDIDFFESYLEGETKKQPHGLDENVIKDLICNYGTAYSKVLSLMNEKPSEPESDREVLKAQTVYAIRNEMAVKLSDVVFRRTGLGSAGYPSRDVLAYCASAMGEQLGWGPLKVEQEIREVDNYFLQMKEKG